MPWVLVSNKCDNPPNVRQINPQAFEQICNALGDTESFQTSVNASETHKRCISAILRGFMPDPSGKSKLTHFARRSLHGWYLVGRHVHTLAVGYVVMFVGIDDALISP